MPKNISTYLISALVAALGIGLDAFFNTMEFTVGSRIAFAVFLATMAGVIYYLQYRNAKISIVSSFALLAVLFIMDIPTLKKLNGKNEPPPMPPQTAIPPLPKDDPLGISNPDKRMVPVKKDLTSGGAKFSVQDTTRPANPASSIHQENNGDGNVNNTGNGNKFETHASK